MNTFRVMFKTEMKLTIRDMNILIFGVGFSVVLTVILGIVMGNKPALEGSEYSFMEQSFGAIVSVGIAATGLMGIPLVVSDYRHKKILKRFKVTPVNPAMLLMVQVLVHFLMSAISLIMVYGTSVLFFDYSMRGPFLVFILSYLLVLFSIYSFGMLLASISPNIKTANLLCCLFYFPMLFLSGATLPYEIMPEMMQKAANFLPLTQGIMLLKATALGLPVHNMLMPVTIMIALAVISIIVSIRFFRWE